MLTGFWVAQASCSARAERRHSMKATESPASNASAACRVRATTRLMSMLYTMVSLRLSRSHFPSPYRNSITLFLTSPKHLGESLIVGSHAST